MNGMSRDDFTAMVRAAIFEEISPDHQALGVDGLLGEEAAISRIVSAAFPPASIDVEVEIVSDPEPSPTPAASATQRAKDYARILGLDTGPIHD